MVATALPQRTRQRYEPRGGALEVIRSTESEVLAVGPAGTGKTLAICWKLHHSLLKYDGSRVLMSRQVLEDLKPAALTTFIQGVKPEMAGVKEFGGNRFYPAEFRYPNGSIMQVVGLDKPGKVMSSEFDKIYINEATELPDDETINKLKSRLRNGKMPNPQLIMDANPSFPQHWLNKRCDEGLTRRITSTHRDNPAYWDAALDDWTPLGRQYVVGILGSLTGADRDRLLDGKWVASEGLVYPEFKPHMIQVVDDLDGWTTYMSADIGSRNPTAILTGHVSGDERVHISHEVYRRDLNSIDIVDAIAEEADLSDPDAIFIDPSAKGTIDALAERGYPVVAASNDIKDGVRQVKTVLNRGFTIDPSCSETIGEYGAYAYPRKQSVNTDADKPAKDHDHAMDALRYLCMGALEPVIDLADFYANQIRSAA